jgi:HAE1 family hydrophobic/amphiphilic exporter-1
MRSLIALAVRRRVSVFMCTIAVAAFGIVGYNRLALELFPDISYPSLTIQTDFPDTAPQEVENLLTRPIEEAVGVLKGLRTIHSVSRPGVSEVTLEFAWNSDMDMLSMEVRDKLDRLILPDGAEDPIVLRFDPSLDPIVRIALAGPDELVAIRRLAEKKLKPDLETLPGIAAAEVRGGLEEEIEIEVDQDKLAALGIPLDRIREVVGFSNINMPGGLLRSKDSQYLIRTKNEFENVEEISRLVIKQAGGTAVRLGDVAVVYRGAKEREEITRLNGTECVEIDIYKEGDANTVNVAGALQGALARWRNKLPEGYKLAILFDQSQFIKQAVNEVRSAALLGGLLAVLVLFVFLRDARSTLIIATSIPLSVLATFILMYKYDISLNIMSLGGLTLGIGMLVDNSIVVLESIYRRKRSGSSLHEAAVEGAGEVGPAVTASTLTTVAVFIPIIFVEGIAGQLFKDQAMTVTISLLASLLVAVTVIPMLSAAGSGDSSRRPGPRSREGDKEAFSMGGVSRIYDRVLEAALNRPWVTLAIAFLLFAASLASLRWIGKELTPSLSEGEFFFEVKMPEGTSLAATDRVLSRMEAEAAEIPAIDKYFSTVGTRFATGGISVNTKAENLGQLNIVMKNRADDATEEKTAEDLRSRYERIPDLEIKMGKPSYFSLKTPVELILYGEDLDALRDYSLRLVERLESIPGLVDVRSSLEAGTPELQVVFDRARLASLDLDMATISETLRNRVLGVVPTRFKEIDREIDIRIRNRESDRRSLDDVRNLVVPGPGGKPLRLLSLADVHLDRGPAEIHRIQQQRAAVITGNLSGRSLTSVVEDVNDVLRRYPPPRGITPEWGGQSEEMKVSFASLRFAILLAVFLVYLVMAATFESFVHPFIVLFTIPLALVGVVAGLLATATNITIIVLIGIVMLVGIVVNNAIVLIDAVNRLRRNGMTKKEAVIRGGHIRLRPILMTALTTILGLLPMAISWGEGAELRSPLAVTVASGLFTSTFLTLLVIPAAYMVVPSLMDRKNGGNTRGGSRE